MCVCGGGGEGGGRHIVDSMYVMEVTVKRSV